jgi:hypothetical protein
MEPKEEEGKVATKEGINVMEKHKTGYKLSLTKQGRKKERKKEKRKS